MSALFPGQLRLSRMKRAFVRFILKAFLFILVMFAAFVGYLNIAGFPPPLNGYILEKINSGKFAIQADKVQLRGLHELVFKNAKIYRKTVLGSPSLEAARISVRLNPFRRIKGLSMINRITIEDSVCRPQKCKCSDPEPAGYFRLRSEIEIALDNCSVLGLTAAQLNFTFHAQGSLVKISNIDAVIDYEDMHGNICGDVSFNTKSEVLTGEFISMIDPAVLLPFVRERHASFSEELIQRFSFFETAPRCELNFKYSAETTPKFILNGNFRSRDLSYRDVDLFRCDGDLSVLYSPGNVNVSINDLVIVREEGMAKGDLTVNAPAQCVDFDFASTLHPYATANLIGGLTNFLPNNFAFNGPVDIEASGVFDYSEDRSKTDFSASAKVENALVKRYEMDTCALKMSMNGKTNRIYDVYAETCDGELTGALSFVVPEQGKTNVKYNVENFSLENAKYRSFLEASTGKEWPDINGLISIRGNLIGQTSGDYLASLKGQGGICIKDGRVFLMPVFGGLSKLMAKIIPGLDFVLRQSNAKADFVIENKKIFSDKIAIEGDILSLQGKGEFSLPDQLDFYVQLKLMKEHTFVAKLLRLVTYPITKLFEFRLKGSTGDPNWYPVNFSLDLLNRLGLRKDKLEESSK